MVPIETESFSYKKTTFGQTVTSSTLIFHFYKKSKVIGRKSMIWKTIFINIEYGSHGTNEKLVGGLKILKIEFHILVGYFLRLFLCFDILTLEYSAKNANETTLVSPISLGGKASF